MDINYKDIELIILPGRRPPENYRPQHNQAYKCWRETWVGYQQEMNQDLLLHSDSFSRQDEVMAIFYQGECAALIFCREVNFNEDATIHDSYFDVWPEIAIHKLCKQGSKILVFSQFTLQSKFRKSYLGLSWKDLLVGLCYERFIRSECHAGATAARVQKQMEEAVYKVNGTPIVKNLPFHKTQSVDLVGFYHDQVCPSLVPGIADLSDVVFKNAISLVDTFDLQMTRKTKRAA
jgi:hypothetical protein